MWCLFYVSCTWLVFRSNLEESKVACLWGKASAVSLEAMKNNEENKLPKPAPFYRYKHTNFFCQHHGAFWKLGLPIRNETENEIINNPSFKKSSAYETLGESRI